MKVKINKSIQIHLQGGMETDKFREILRCAKRNISDGHHSLFLSKSLEDIKEMAQFLLNKTSQDQDQDGIGEWER